MGKASSRKRDALAVRDVDLPSPANNPDVANAVVRADAVFAEARHLADLLKDAASSAALKRYFHGLSACLSDVQRCMRSDVMDAQKTLGLPVSLAGVSGMAVDGRRVVVDLDGVVADSAPDSVLESLGLRPAIAGGAAPALPDDDGGRVARLNPAIEAGRVAL